LTRVSQHQISSSSMSTRVSQPAPDQSKIHVTTFIITMRSFISCHYFRPFTV